MCLIVFAVAMHPALPLVVLANRDEYYARPALPAHRWPDAPAIFGGRDVEKGGTWLGVTTGGRFAAVTNVRAPLASRQGASRGALVREALLSHESPGEWAAAIDRARYPAFNLLVGDGRGLFYANESSAEVLRVPPGVHGLSNARLDDPWPKVQRATARLPALFDPGAAPTFDVEAAFAALADHTQAADDQLPSTGVPLALERRLSPAFITRPGYGTRACTVVLFHHDGTIRFLERTFGEGGAPGVATAVQIDVLADVPADIPADVPAGVRIAGAAADTTSP